METEVSENQGSQHNQNIMLLKMTDLDRNGFEVKLGSVNDLAVNLGENYANPSDLTRPKVERSMSLPGQQLLESTQQPG